MALVQSLIDILPSSGLDPDSGLVSRSAYGYEVSFTATRRSRRLRVAAARPRERGDLRARRGRLSVYLDGLEFRLGPGDLLRIPALAVHWKQNRGSKEAILHELHSPPRGVLGTGQPARRRTSARTPRTAATAMSASARPTARRATCGRLRELAGRCPTTTRCSPAASRSGTPPSRRSSRASTAARARTRRSASRASRSRSSTRSASA